MLFHLPLGKCIAESDPFLFFCLLKKKKRLLQNDKELSCSSLQGCVCTALYRSNVKGENKHLRVLILVLISGNIKRNARKRCDNQVYHAVFWLNE